MADINFHDVTSVISDCCATTGKKYEEIKEDVVEYTGKHIKMFKEYPHGIVVNPTDDRGVMEAVGNFYFEPVICDQLFIMWEDSISVEAYL